MRNATLSVLIVALAAVAACNRTADKTPASGPQTSAPSVPPSVNQPSSSALQPQAPSGSSASSSTGPSTSSVQNEPPSKELSKEEESTGQPRPGTGGSDHSTPSREPGAKG